MRKLILIDSDGTLRKDDGTITETAKNKITKLIKLGNYVIICSARPRYHTKQIYNEIGSTPIIISSNGSEIYDVENNKIISENTVDSDICYELIKYSFENDIRMIVTVEDCEFVTKEIRNKKQVLLDRNTYQQQLNNCRIKQCMFIDKKVNILNKLKDKINNSNKIKIINEISINDQSEEKWFSIGNYDSSKGNALEIIANYLNVPLEDTIAIGNDYNDVSMFKKAGFSIAVDNALDGVKKECDYVTLSNNEDGVAHALEKIINDEFDN